MHWTSYPLIFIRFTLNINIDSYLYVLSYLKKRRKIYKRNYKRADIFIRQLGAASITKNLTSSLKEVEVVGRQPGYAWLLVPEVSRRLGKLFLAYFDIVPSFGAKNDDDDHYFVSAFARPIFHLVILILLGSIWHVRSLLFIMHTVLCILFE